MLGYTEADLLGKMTWEFTHEDDVAENKRLYERMMKEGIPFKLEKRLIRADGSTVWMDVSVDLVMDAAGNPQSAVAVEVDITARKQAEEALQQLNLQLESRVQKRTATIQAINQSLRDEIAERKRIEEALRQSEEAARASEEKLRTLFDLLPVGISFLDPEGKILQINTALLDIVKLSRAQLFSQVYKSRRYIRANGAPMPLSEFASARALAENRTVYNVETGIILENGETVWASVSAAPVDVADVGVVVVTIDITESKRAERGRKRAIGACASFPRAWWNFRRTNAVPWRVNCMTVSVKPWLH
jgi:PAS domain S-box-containing protein